MAETPVLNTKVKMWTGYSLPELLVQIADWLALNPDENVIDIAINSDTETDMDNEIVDTWTVRVYFG